MINDQFIRFSIELYFLVMVKIFACQGNCIHVIHFLLNKYILIYAPLHIIGWSTHLIKNVSIYSLFWLSTFCYLTINKVCFFQKGDIKPYHEHLLNLLITKMSFNESRQNQAIKKSFKNCLQVLFFAYQKYITLRDLYNLILQIWGCCIIH